MRRLFVLLLLLFSTACSLLHNTGATTTELERVAKDWCLTIRASQVLCVYPLSEDVQVGDLYLVNRSVADQVAEYEKRGFLPFDMLLARLQPEGYEQMYRGSYKTSGAFAQIPHQWQFPAASSTAATDWSSAPRAAFPSYSFSVRRGQGLRLAVPVQAVPVGLSLMNTGSAHGSIAISDASTYGVDEQSLDQQVEAWARCPASRALLSRYAPQTDSHGIQQKQYLRIVARVYLTGAVNVSLANDEQRGAGLDVGVAQAINLANTDTSGDAAARTTAGYQTVLNALNTSVNGGTGTPTPQPAAQPATPQPATAQPVTPQPATPQPSSNQSPSSSQNGTTVATSAAAATTTATLPKPGGSIRIIAASSRTITMNETFERPLVVGYIAFDRPIEEGGVLGGAQPTLQRLEGFPLLALKPSTSVSFGPDGNTVAIRQWLTVPGNRTRLHEWLANHRIDPAELPLVENGEKYALQRQEIVDTFGIGGLCGTTH